MYWMMLQATLLLDDSCLQLW